MADDSGLHAIGEVASATGITPETLRIWERRYGRPRAVRLPSGHRRYTAEQIAWLRRVAEALARGHRPHKVLALKAGELDALLAPPTGEGDDGELEPMLVMARDFRAAQLRAALASHWDAQDAVGFLTDRVAPLLRQVGREWAAGRFDIRHEHFVTEVVQDVLRHARTTFGRPEGPGGVLLTTLRGERHGLGLQMAGLVCASLGLPYVILGVDSPTEEIVRASRELHAAVVGISVSLSSGGVETDRALTLLRRALPGHVRLVVGGDGARRARRGPRGVEYVSDLRAWQAALRALAVA